MPVRGRDWYMNRVKDLVERFPQAADDAVAAEAFNLQTASMLQVPVDTSRLKNSAITYSEIGANEGNPTWRVFYGTDYAFYVHERLDVHHPYGKAKYLEDPLNALRATYVQNLWRRISANRRKAGLDE